jgi:hypothetical protein
MEIETDLFVEHRTPGDAFGAYGSSLYPTCVLPGACTSCNGSSSTSCCNSLKERVSLPGLAVLVAPIKTFDKAARVFSSLPSSPLSGVSQTQKPEISN